MIEVKNISKSFDKKKILNDISFTINKGECVSIIGQSGIGKSVLLKSIIGLLQVDSGTIIVDDIPLESISFKSLQSLRSKFGMVFQFGALFDSMTVSENIGLALQRRMKVDKLEIDSKIMKSLEEVNMKDTYNKMPSELSGGMKKRVGIARAIALNPEYMLYDEPTTGLDPIMTDSINKLISKFHKKGATTSVIVTHEMKTVRDVSHRAIMLHDGKVQFDGTTDDLFNSDDPIVKAFLVGDSTYKQKKELS